MGVLPCETECWALDTIRLAVLNAWLKRRRRRSAMESTKSSSVRREKKQPSKERILRNSFSFFNILWTVILKPLFQNCSEHNDRPVGLDNKGGMTDYWKACSLLQHVNWPPCLDQSYWNNENETRKCCRTRRWYGYGDTLLHSTYTL